MLVNFLQHLHIILSDFSSMVLSMSSSFFSLAPFSLFTQGISVTAWLIVVILTVLCHFSLGFVQIPDWGHVTSAEGFCLIGFYIRFCSVTVHFFFFCWFSGVCWFGFNFGEQFLGQGSPWKPQWEKRFSRMQYLSIQNKEREGWKHLKSGIL